MAIQFELPDNMPGECCFNCRFFRRFIQPQNPMPTIGVTDHFGVTTEGLCRRYPPTLITSATGFPVEALPKVSEKFWCGEWATPFPNLLGPFETVSCS